MIALKEEYHVKVTNGPRHGEPYRNSYRRTDGAAFDLPSPIQSEHRSGGVLLGACQERHLRDRGDASERFAAKAQRLDPVEVFDSL
jgi:hypothetical protein